MSIGFGIAKVRFFFTDSYHSSTSFVIDGLAARSAVAKSAFVTLADFLCIAFKKNYLQSDWRSAPEKFFVVWAMLTRSTSDSIGIGCVIIFSIS